MHFPSLIRRKNYKTKRCGNYYANYGTYHHEILEDCKYRCVYCDVKLEEIGGEGMHLDHFKPQKHFPKLENDPNNLVLACAKCNQLKSHWWPGNKLHGFIDPFDKEKLNYFQVDEKGKLVAIKPPAAYFIELLLLNRLSRVNIRRCRIISLKKEQLMDSIITEMDNLIKQTDAIIKKRLPILAAALREVKSLN